MANMFLLCASVDNLHGTLNIKALFEMHLVSLGVDQYRRDSVHLFAARNQTKIHHLDSAGSAGLE